jgi:hypothetical protein
MSAVESKYSANAVALMLLLLSTWSQAEEQAEQPEQAEYIVKLESTITGDKEQPAVSYFIPWQEIGTPDKLQWNMDNKHDDTLDMVDRDVMLRSMQVYKQMNIEAPPNISASTNTSTNTSTNHQN